MTDIGARVWAVHYDTEDVVYAYGMGVYIGDRLLDGWDHPDMIARCEKTIRRSDAGESPRFDAKPFYDRKVAAGEMSREMADRILADAERRLAAERARPLADRATDLAKALGMNPVIKLDNGGYVWGAECWWGDATDATPAGWAKGRAIVTVPATTWQEPA
jgi:hypothetical protein